jgi:hypothetical protein
MKNVWYRWTQALLILHWKHSLSILHIDIFYHWLECIYTIVVYNVEWLWLVESNEIFMIYQGCGIAMPDSSHSYIEHVGQVDFPG